MKLIHKFTLLYLLITLVVLIMGGVFSYHVIKKEVDKEQTRYLKRNIDFTMQELSRGIYPDSLFQNKMEVQTLDMSIPEIEFFVRDTLVWLNYLKRFEPQVKVSASRKIDDRHYYISTYGAIVDTQDITDAVVKSIGGIFLIMLIVTALVSVLISRKILKPFNRTLKAMRSFRLREKKPLSLMSTSTSEFKRLNLLLENMTEKMQDDYAALKEFSENASHELQTPLSIIMGKLELLMDSDISDEQARLIHSAQNAVDKLSKMGQSLTLLTKLGNREFESPGAIDFSTLLKECLFAFQELLEMKSLTLEENIEDGVLISMHPVLANILLNNLMSNAIRHNNPKGVIRVRLNQDHLEIANTGGALSGPPEEMFERFRKNEPNSQSIGLGLSIVKQICSQNDLHICYEYRAGMHVLQISFKMLSNSA